MGAASTGWIGAAIVRRSRSQRALVALVQVLALATWFSASAVVPSLETEWGMDAVQAVWLTVSTQFGFVVGALVSAVLNLADRIRPQLLLAASAAGCAAATLSFAALSHGPESAVPLRFVTGVFLAGVYPVGMKVMASWAPIASRGRSLGFLVGALTLGSALPHLIGVIDAGWRTIMAVAGVAALLAGLISVIWLRTGPHLSASAFVPDPRFVVRMLRDPQQRMVNLAYLGHMWELYALWTWLPVWALAVGAGGGRPDTIAAGSFLVIGVAGVIGCLIGGWSSDRFGRRRTAALALGVSGACCLLSPLAAALPVAPLLAFALVWGAAVIADSGVFSTMLSELVDRRYVGTALTTQMAMGYLLTIVTIQAVPLLAQASGWQFAFLALAPGPVVGVILLLRPAFATRLRTESAT